MVDFEDDCINASDLVAKLNWWRGLEMVLHCVASLAYVCFWVHSWLFALGLLHVPLVSPASTPCTPCTPLPQRTARTRPSKPREPEAPCRNAV